MSTPHQPDKPATSAQLNHANDRMEMAFGRAQRALSDNDLVGAEHSYLDALDALEQIRVMGGSESGVNRGVAICAARLAEIAYTTRRYEQSVQFADRGLDARHALLESDPDVPHVQFLVSAMIIRALAQVGLQHVDEATRQMYAALAVAEDAHHDRPNEDSGQALWLALSSTALLESRSDPERALRLRKREIALLTGIAFKLTSSDRLTELAEAQIAAAGLGHRTGDPLAVKFARDAVATLEAADVHDSDVSLALLRTQAEITLGRTLLHASAPEALTFARSAVARATAAVSGPLGDLEPVESRLVLAKALLFLADADDANDSPSEALTVTNLAVEVTEELWRNSRTPNTARNLLLAKTLAAQRLAADGQFAAVERVLEQCRDIIANAMKSDLLPRSEAEEIGQAIALAGSQMESLASLAEYVAQMTLWTTD